MLLRSVRDCAASMPALSSPTPSTPSLAVSLAIPGSPFAVADAFLSYPTTLA